MEDLAKAFQMLNQSVNGLVLQKSLNTANEQVNQIRMSEMKEEEKRGALRGLANDLTMRLTGMGMDPNAIQQATQAIAPKPAFQNAEQALMYGDAAEQKRAQEIIDDQRKFEMGKMREATTVKLAAGQGKEAVKSLNDFRQKHAKEQFKQLDAISAAADMLNEGNFTGYTSSLKSIIKSVEGGRLTDEDFKLASPNQDIFSGMKRAYDKLLLNKPLEEDQKYVGDMQKALQLKIAKRIAQKGQGFARSRAGKVGADYDSFYGDLMNESLVGYGVELPGLRQPQAAQGASAPSSVPAAPTAPNMMNFIRSK